MRLTKPAKTSLIESMRSAIGDTAPPGPRARPVPPRAADFSLLPLYRQMRTQQAAAELMQASNPYFRTHDVRAGVTTAVAGRPLVNFASYDYLGLNGHPAVAGAAVAAIERFGTSVSASRLVAGERALHHELEAAIAGFLGVEDALTFVSGHATNVGAIATLLTKEDLVLHDSLSHNSIVVGAELSQATRRSFPHNDLDALEQMLRTTRSGARHCLIAVEGLYSMDGDLPDLGRLVEIKSRYDCWLMVDEAHALGVLGRTGRGLAEHFGIDPRAVDIWMGTLSKTLAACGGFIAGSRHLTDILRYNCPTFVYSVGLSPPLTAAALAAIGILAREPERVTQLAANGRRLLQLAREAELDTGTSMGHAILAVMVGDSLRAAKLAERLLERGYNVLPIIYPAVPVQSARLRFFVNAFHSHDQLAGAIAATREELSRLEAERFGLGRAAQALMARS